MNPQNFILKVISALGLLAIGALGFLGIIYSEDLITIQNQQNNLGSTISTLNPTDIVKDSRSVINTNFSNLNTDKLERSNLVDYNGFGTLTAQTITATSTTATSTIHFALAAIQRLGIGSTATTTILGNNSTSTFSGGIRSVNAGGLSSTNGLTLTGGSLLNTGSATSTWPSAGLSVAGGGLVSSQGLTLTGGNLLSSGLLTITNAATSTFTGALTVSHLQATSLTSSGALSLFSTGANSVLFQTNGSERAVLTSGGNLGIGTTTPGTLLSVAGVGVFGGSTGTTTIQHGVNLATLGGGVTIATTSPSTRYKLLVDGAATIVQKRISSAASPTFNWSDSNYQIMALSQAGHSISFTGGQPGATLRLELCQDSTGNRTVTSWGSNILFMTSDLTNSTSTPGLTTKANTCNLFSFTVSVGTSTQIYRGTLPLKDK